jgi:uncharacterized membrane protein YcaP (DUF421 family)
VAKAREWAVVPLAEGHETMLHLETPILELTSCVRREGIEDIAQVAKVFLEGDGQLTVIPKAP